jgi:hypothetical protein
MSDTSFGRALLAVLALLVATLGPAVGLAVAAAAGGYAYDVPWTINSSLEPSAADSLDEQGIRDWAVPASDTNLGYDDHQDLLRASARLAGSRLAPETTRAIAEIGPAGNPGAFPTVRHHVFNKFRGDSPASQKYRDFFADHGIKVDDWTLEIPKPLHTNWVHRAGNNWTTHWKQWIDANPNASTLEVWQQGGRMIDDYGLSRYMPFVRYR